MINADNGEPDPPPRLHRTPPQIRARRRPRPRGVLIVTMAAAAIAIFSTVHATAETVSCAGGEIVQQPMRLMPSAESSDSQPDLLVRGDCTVSKSGDYFYRAVNIVDNGKLRFIEPPPSEPPTRTNFWAASIIIENGGALQAGVGDQKPYGTNAHELNIILYGKDQSDGNPIAKPGLGALCYPQADKENFLPCGIPTRDKDKFGGNAKIALPGGVTDYFYQYGTLFGDNAKTDQGESGHFGYKVLGLSYGGTLELRGYKGTTRSDGADKSALDSGTSWVRLASDLAKDGTRFIVEPSVAGDWGPGDRIVVTTSDYLPNHSEELIIDKVDGATITIRQPAKYAHNGTKFPLKARLAKAGDGYKKLNAGSELLEAAETRAAVALLTRSIRIVSGGDIANETFDAATKRNPNYSFGAHTAFRQGFQKLQIQGVEFNAMGQGGRLAHYPVHFHMARETPKDTFIKDSSVNESMTRWIVLHSTQNVLLARNVGFKSIGHGFYLEDATEAGNKFHSNIGILARGGVEGPDNPRNIPGILAQNGLAGKYPNRNNAYFRSDILYPTIFWITNGWNDFIGNMAAGANMCGNCFWLLPAQNADTAFGDEHAHAGMKWSGYAAMQDGKTGRAGMTPLKSFFKNYCSTAMHALNTTGDPSPCNGVANLADPVPDARMIKPIRGIAPDVDPDDKVNYPKNRPYYPTFTSYRAPTICNPALDDSDPQSCARVGRCDNSNPSTCATTVIDSFTTSFNWAETNFSALWLRGGWNLVERLFMSDVQNGGVGLISGGDYSRSSAPLGYWTLVNRSVFVGRSKPGNDLTGAGGPARDGKTLCDAHLGNACVIRDSSIVFQFSNWSTNRMFNIYDGPAYQDGNAFLDIKTSDCNNQATCMYFGTPGVRRSSPTANTGYLPNAAIGWKQPNGFYYPPAFHSSNLFFDNVDIRHYVTLPIFEPGTYRTDRIELGKQLIGVGDPPPSTLFDGFTDIDRQTELNDDDGSLTGFVNTVSVNEDPFFSAPIQTAECRSNLGVGPDSACAGGKKPQTQPTARTSPYDYVTTVIYPECALKTSQFAGLNEAACGSQTTLTQFDSLPGLRVSTHPGRGGMWSRECGSGYCTGVPLFRQYLTGDDKARTREWATWFDKDHKCDDPKNAGSEKCRFPFARMSGANTWQRNVMTVNHGTYFIDTSRSQDNQEKDEALGRFSDTTASYVDCRYKAKPPANVPSNCQPRSVSVFEGGKTYHVFFLFAKESTKQVYQVWVGPGFNPATDVKGTRMTDTNLQYFAEAWSLPKEWKAEMIDGPVDPATGQRAKDVLQVTVDFSVLPKLSPPIAIDPKKDDHGVCKPASFCSGTGSSCTCNLKATDPMAIANPDLLKSCQTICATWAVKDLDCPKEGCLGFRFKLPAGFKPDNKNHRPDPKPFPSVKTDPDWKKFQFVRTKEGPDAGAGGACYYSDANTPGKGNCEARD